jgi:Domain of unknown function (DUF4390)
MPGYTWARQSGLINAAHLAIKTCQATAIQMAFSTRCLSVLADRSARLHQASVWKLLIIGLMIQLFGCEVDSQQCRIISASANKATHTLDLSLSVRLNPRLLDALDHGIPLRFEFVVSPEGSSRQIRTVQLDYLPMAKRYELSGAPRTFDSRLQLIAALDLVKLPIDGLDTGKGTVFMRLDTDVLPAPMRLSAFFDSEWRVSSASVQWGLL